MSLSFKFVGPVLELQALQAWGVRARDIVEAGGIDVVEAYRISERWGLMNSPYPIMERDLELVRAGVSVELTRFVAACHVLRHYKASREANESDASAEFWMRAFHVARHAGTMLRADTLIQSRATQRSATASAAANAKHAAAKANRDRAILLYAEGDYTSVAEAARVIAPQVDQATKTVDTWLRAYIKATRH